MLMTARANAAALKAKLFRGFADASRLSIVEALLRQTAATEVRVDGGGIREGVVVAMARRGPEWRRGLAELLVASRRRATR